MLFVGIIVALFMNTYSKRIEIQKEMQSTIDSLQSANEVLKTVVDQYEAKKVVLTAYNSLKNQTDDTPFITASGSRTSFKTLALTQDLVTNYLSDDDSLIDGISFGDTVHIVIVKSFIVEDVKNKRYLQGGDIWTKNYADAMKFGVRDGYLIYKKKESVE